MKQALLLIDLTENNNLEYAWNCNIDFQNNGVGRGVTM